MKVLLNYKLTLLVAICFLLIGTSCFSKNDNENCPDKAAIEWTAHFFKERGSFEIPTFNCKGKSLEDCFHVIPIEQQNFDSSTVCIYFIGLNFDHFYDKILVQHRNEAGESRFELIWDTLDINKVIDIVDFFDTYRSFSDKAKTRCYERAIIDYNDFNEVEKMTKSMFPSPK